MSYGGEGPTKRENAGIFIMTSEFASEYMRILENYRYERTRLPRKEFLGFSSFEPDLVHATDDPF